MSLVVSDEVQREAQRIIAAKDSFDVLQIHPRDCSKELVLRVYEEKVALFKKLFRSKAAMQAKARLDDAKMRLTDERLRSKELAAHHTITRDCAKDNERIEALEARTKILEMRAAAILEKDTASTPVALS